MYAKFWQNWRKNGLFNVWVKEVKITSLLHNTHKSIYQKNEREREREKEEREIFESLKKIILKDWSRKRLPQHDPKPRKPKEKE